jgi:hypothetical protein
LAVTLSHSLRKGEGAAPVSFLADAQDDISSFVLTLRPRNRNQVSKISRISKTFLAKIEQTEKGGKGVEIRRKPLG